jgi:phosphatidate cytidylyltransferase
MALHWPVFLTRVKSAAIFVLVMGVGLLTNHWMFLLLFSVIHMGCWKEYQELMVKIHPGYAGIESFHKYGVRIAGWGLLLLGSTDHWRFLGVSVSAIGFWLSLIFAFMLPIMEILFTRNFDLKNIGISLRGLIYISLSLALMVNIRSGDIWRLKTDGELILVIDPTSPAYVGFLVPLIIIASIWINDTMAYIVGSLIGKTPLTSISPKKTWEGTIGGIVLSTGILTLVGYLINAVWVHYLAISLISSIAGTFGDLYESRLKRLAGVKDSGALLPGHGGFLDRFDSLLFAVPFVWLYAVVFM